MIVYVSCPVSIDIKYLKHVVERLQALGHMVFYWDRKEAYCNVIINGRIDAVVLIPPNNSWRVHRSSLPPGCVKELKAAEKENIPVQLAYKNTAGEVNFYSTGINLQSESYEGIPGTAMTLQIERVESPEDESFNKPTFSNTILLLNQ